MSFVWYEVELPYQDKTFFAGSLENANRMALDLHKDFFLVAVVRRESGRAIRDKSGSSRVVDLIYRDEKRVSPPLNFLHNAAYQLRLF